MWSYGSVLRKVIRKLLVRMIMFASVLLNSRQQSARQERESRQFEMHGYLPKMLHVYQHITCDASANTTKALRPYSILSSILFYYKNPLTGAYVLWGRALPID
jgi:hypothetical protein